MITLEEHNAKMSKIYATTRAVKNGISCPKCGEELSDVDGSVLSSFPPKMRVICSSCGYTGHKIA